MIYGFLHPGSGLGNQLHRYVATRVTAERLHVPFSMIGKENFKGKSFMDLNLGEKNELSVGIEMPAGKLKIANDHNLWEEKTNYYNPEFNFIEDGVVIDGEFQDERYFDKYDLWNWLHVEPLEIPEDTCVIGFRGGEFTIYPDLFLPWEYWEQAIKIMKDKGIKRFVVHTDDESYARYFFRVGEDTEEWKVIHDIGINWRSMRFAKNAIIANSSFYIFPRWLNKGFTIAPRYWARHNIKEWSMPQNYYRDFQYL